MIFSPKLFITCTGNHTLVQDSARLISVTKNEDNKTYHLLDLSIYMEYIYC